MNLKAKYLIKCFENSVSRRNTQAKLTIQDVIAINPNEAAVQDKKYISLTDMPWVMLKRLMCAHSESRDMTASEANNIESSIGLYNRLFFISDISEDGQNISPIDILAVVYQCCDPLMKQIFFQKLYLCKIAVPFLYKHWETQESCHAILSVWPLRSLAIENKIQSGSSLFKSKEVDLLELETKVLAFARFGRTRFSKSKLLNSLLSAEGCKTFYSIDCPSGMTPRVLSNGQIEMFWLLMIGDNKDKFQDAMTFLNMRGDLSEHFNVHVLSFIADFADAVTLITDKESMTKRKNEIKTVVLTFSSVMLVIADPLKPDVVTALQSFQSEVVAANPNISLSILGTHKGVIEQNVVDMVSTMSRHITSHLKSKCTKSFQSRLNLAMTMTDTLKTDEQEENCEHGRKEAQTLVQQMNKAGESRRWKQILTPAHSTYSPKLGKLVKTLEREKSFTEVEKIVCEIKEVRKKQTQSITETVQLFIATLLRNENSIFKIKFFLCWLHFYIEREKKTILQPLIHESRCAWEKLQTLKIKETEVPSEVENQEAVISQLDLKIDEASFSIQHFFREVGHIYDAVLQLNEGSSKFKLPPLDKIGTIIGKLVVEGQKIELIDGESFYLPYLWTKAILKQVDQLVDSGKFMTIGVLGLQSSGKSTLLNTMFGSQLSTRTSTRGINVQLIPTTTLSVQGTLSPFSYVLVADTEGLISPELSHVQHEHDTELATVNAGIGDITMLYILGDNTSEIRDILQVIVHGLLRLKMTNRDLDVGKSFAFIHQNVTDTSASEHTICGLSKLMQTLDEMTEEAAHSEGILEISKFNQIIEFDINSQVCYLKNMWQGNRPMARVNNEYSNKVVDMKCKIVQKALQMKNKSYKSLTDIIEHTYMMWKYVLNEDCVISFRNALEIRAYMAMERLVQDKLWRLESMIRDNVAITQNKLANCNQIDKLRRIADKLINELSEKLADEKSVTENVIKRYFEKNKNKDIIIQWKNSQHCRIDDLCLKLECVIRWEIEKSLGNRFVEIMTVAYNAKHEEELYRKFMKVADLNKGKMLTKAEIDTLFDGIWQSFLNYSDSTSYTLEKNRKQMSTIFFDCLKQVLKRDTALLKEALIKTSYLEPLPNLTKLNGSYQKSGIDSYDISFTLWHFKYLIRNSTTMKQVPKLVNQIFEAVDEKINTLCQINDEITEMAVNKFMFEISDIINDILIGNTEYVFKRPFYVKLFVHVSRFAHPVFQKHNEKYLRTLGIAAGLEQYRVQQKVTFEAHLSGRRPEDLAANLFSNVIEIFAEEWVSQNFPIKVIDELHSTLPSVKNRVIVEICTELLNEGDFNRFVRYLQTPKEYASLWITEKCNSHLFDLETHAYVTISTSLLNMVFRHVKECVITLERTYNKTPSMQSWIKEFQNTLKAKNISIQSESFRYMMNVKPIRNVKYFTNEIIADLETSEKSLQAKFSKQTSTSVKWTWINPIDRIIKKIWGCPERCAFCGEPCAQNKDHDGSVHYSIQHRPVWCKGIILSTTEFACFESCESLIQSDKTHTCGLFNYLCSNETGKACGISHKYRDYKKYLPNWDIKPTPNMHDTSKFWMWFVATYRTELHEYYDYEVDHIPSSWKAITKDEAKRSLDQTYNA